MEQMPPAERERAEAMEPELRQQIEERAYALWDADGRPEGRALSYWLKAEQEIVNRSAAGEEDPLAGVDRGSARSDDAA